jgi:hypothetical protein
MGERIGKLNFIKNKSFGFVKDSMKRIRTKATDMEKIFAEDTFDKGQLPKTNKKNS